MTGGHPIRIAFVIDTIETPAAGTERQLLALLEGLDPAEFAPHVICLRGSPWLEGWAMDVPLTLLDVRSLRPPQVFRDLARFRTLCRRERFDIVQTFFVDANIFGTIGAALAGTGVVVSSRRNMGHWHNPLQINVLRFLRRWTDWYLSNSAAVADNTRVVEGAAPERIVVIHNGLEILPPERRRPEWRTERRAAWGIAGDETLVGCVANLRDVKNLPELVEAAALLDAESPRLRFVIVGEGPDRRALEGQIERLGLAGRVILAGRMLDVGPALAAFDLAVQCSRAESFSNSLIEYMAARLPIVASDIPGNAEAIGHERNGLLYSPGDPRGLAAAIRRLNRDRELADRLAGTAADEASARFSMSGMLAAHAAFYRRITGRSDSP